MKKLLLVTLLPLASFAAEHQHDAAQATAAGSTDHSAHTTQSEPVQGSVVPDSQASFAGGVSMSDVAHEHGGMWNWFLFGERLERIRLAGEDVDSWDAQAWIGSDLNKLWVKSEGEWLSDQRELESSELQLLYSRSIAPYWDLQAGLRFDEGNAASRQYATVGVQGLALYWFEVDAAMFVNDESGLHTRLQAEYDLRLTQKLFLQPRLEWNQAFANDEAAGISQGAFDSSFALRLRYEVIREFAPYVGVEWNIGGDDDEDESRIVAGVRFWY